MGTPRQFLAVMLLAALCAGGCAGRKVHQPHREKPEELFERYFGQSMDEFKNRKIYAELNCQVIETIPDKHLEQAVRDFIAIRIEHDWENDTRRVPALGPGFSAVYFLSILDAEVNNGGFNQLYYNSGRVAVEEARRGADLLGLPALSLVIAKALEIEEAEQAKMTRVKEAGTLDAFFDSYDDISFESVDDEYLQLDLDLEKAIIEFIRRRCELFEGRVPD